jgi:nucleotide-binding universal stress UspA family protein
MKTILVPTDFSANAFIAGQYAAALAKEIDAKILFYHVYITLYSGFKETGVSVQQIESSERDAAESMASLLQTMQKENPNVEIDGVHEKGFMIDALVNRLKNESDIALIVMGTKGVTNMAETVFGSTTYEVIKKSTIPVLVVPETTGDFSMKKVGFFTDYQIDEVASVKKVHSILSNVSAVDFYHFDYTKRDDEDERRSAWVLKAKAALDQENIQLKEIEVDKVDLNAVSRVANENGLDLMIFTRPHKSFFEKIFMKSLTKEVVSYPFIPALYINE